MTQPPASFKICSGCGATCHTGALECRQCGHAFRIAFNPAQGTVIPMAPPFRGQTAKTRPVGLYVAGGVIAGVILLWGIVEIQMKVSERRAVARQNVERQQRRDVDESQDEPVTHNTGNLGPHPTNEELYANFRSRMQAPSMAGTQTMIHYPTPPDGSLYGPRDQVGLPSPMDGYYAPMAQSYGYQSNGSVGNTAQPPQVVWHPNPATARVMPPGTLHAMPRIIGAPGFPPSPNYNPGGKVIYR